MSNTFNCFVNISMLGMKNAENMRFVFFWRIWFIWILLTSVTIIAISTFAVALLEFIGLIYDFEYELGFALELGIL